MVLDGHGGDGFSAERAHALGRCVASSRLAGGLTRARGWLAACVTLALCLAGASSAFGASRYASPTPSGTADCFSPANACDVKTAIQNAGANDDIFVPGNLGDYSVGATIRPSASGIHVHGTNGRPRLIISAPGDLRIQGASSTAENLYVEGPGPSTPFALDASGDSANNVISRAGSGNGCYLGGGGTMTNSVCWAVGSAGLAVETDGANTFRNDTFVGGTEAALKAFGRGGVAGNDTLVNVIARSGPSGHDLEAGAPDNTADATISATYSNYATTVSTGTAARDHINGDGTDQSAAPLFANAASGDFHEVSGSPTIDAGVNDPANGSTDFDGDPRIANARTDIGADEAPAGTSGGGGGGGPAATPAVSTLRVSPTAFPAASSGPSARAARRVRRRVFGTKVSYRLNEAATVRFTVQQAQPGRKTGKGKKTRCVPPTRNNRKAKKCTRVVTLRGSFTLTGRAGANSFRFTGRLAGKKLSPGRYTLVATPSAAGKTGPAVSTAFRIIK